MFYCITKKITHRIICCSTLVLAGVLSLTLLREPAAVSAASHEWGLSFQKTNEPPVPNLTAEELKPYNAFYCSPRQEKTLYLTFDAGYENGNTAAILDALKKHNAPGAFFVVGSFVKENPELVKRMVAEGHIVGNHTCHHPDMRKKSKADFQKELTDLEALFKETTGVPLSKFYRPPEGKFTNENLQWADELGYKTIFWSLAYVDWNTGSQPSHDQAFAKLIPRTHDGAIVLLHTTSATNAAILDELLTKWEEMGYTFGSLNDL